MRVRRRLVSFGLWVFVGFMGGVALLLFTLLAWNLAYWDRIYPGVYVGPVSLAGLTVDQAEARLREAFPYPTQGRVRLTWQGRTWQARPLDLGVMIDYRAVAEAAWKVGRTGPWWARWKARWQAWRRGVNLPLPLLFHEGWAYAWVHNTVAPTVETLPQDAQLRLAVLQVDYRPGASGRVIAWEKLREDLARTIVRMPAQAQVPLAVVQVSPAIPEAQDVAKRLETLLTQGLLVTLPDAEEGDPGPWDFPPEQVAQWLRIERVEENGQARYRVRADVSSLRSWLVSLAPQVFRLPENPRFAFDPETRTLRLLKPGITGRQLDVDASLQAIARALEQGQTQAALVLRTQAPAVPDDARAEDLGIRELVAEHTTYFYGSSWARMTNIQVAGSKFNGYLVAPGEVFSMVAVLGEISLENGYKEAPIIFGNRTIQGVGGGVCQVSTTLFRTVFFGGYPIVERWPHSYRVYYYELTASGRIDPRMAGLDATVYVPIVDFKFKNDTPYWILMEVEVNIPHRYIRWRFYSTSDGREVRWGTTGLQDVEPPPEPRYIKNPDLEPGEIRQTDWPVEGGRVTVWRKVYRDGQLLFEDSYTTRYKAWPAVCEYGPGTEGMPPENPDPEHPCQAG